VSPCCDSTEVAETDTKNEEQEKARARHRCSRL
jgi:hypothetical protein